MADSLAVTGARNRYWMVEIARAVVMAIPAIAITFTNHYPESVDGSSSVPHVDSQAFYVSLDTLGLVVFGVFAVLAGLVSGVGAFTLADPVARTLFVVQGVVGVLAGAIALIFNGNGVGVLLSTMTGWAVLSGFAELYCGIRARKRSPIARDWLVVGVFTVALAVILLLIPSDVVLTLGLFGAYAAIMTVYLVIGGLSLLWGDQRPTAVADNTEHPA